jgi:hypothetical protein
VGSVTFLGNVATGPVIQRAQITPSNFGNFNSGP